MSSSRLHFVYHDRFIIILLFCIVVILGLRTRYLANSAYELRPMVQRANLLTQQVDQCERLLDRLWHPLPSVHLPRPLDDQTAHSLSMQSDGYRLLLLVSLGDASTALEEISFWNVLTLLESSGVEVVAVLACRTHSECRRLALSQHLQMPIYFDEDGVFLRELGAAESNQTPLRILVNQKGTMLHLSSEVLSDRASQGAYLQLLLQLIS